MIESTTIARRDDQQATGSVTLAAERLNIRNKNDHEKLSLSLARDRIVGAKPWNHFEKIGEVHFALTRAARIAGYTRLKAVRWSPDRKQIIDEIDSGPAADVVRSIYSRVGGVRGLMERYFLHMKVPGESHLIRYRDGDTVDGYQFVSGRELHDQSDPATGIQIAERGRAGGLRWVTMPGAGGFAAAERRVAQQDYFGRVWMPNSAWLDVPESPLSALDTQCTLLDEMTLAMRAAMRSRLMTSGILYFSNKVREAIGGKHKTGPNQTVLDVLNKIISENAQRTDDAVSMIPIMMMGEAMPGEVMEWLTLDRQVYETDIQMRSELIDRILFGLDINTQATQGNTDTNHWGAWANNADELRLAVIPDVEAACWSFERLILIPELQAQGVDNADIRDTGIWYDLSEASVKGNREEATRQLRDRGLLQALPALRAAGYSEEDMLTGIDYIRWFGQHVSKDPYLATFGMPEADKIDWELVSNKPAGRPEENPGDTPLEGPGVGDPGSPDPSDNESDSPPPEI